MALPLPPGLTPPEIAFLCEMELVTVIPRQRLEGLHLLGGPLPPLHPPHRAPLPLWLALLLKRQNRANIVPPPWLTVSSLTALLTLETSLPTFTPSSPLPPTTPPFSPPFLPTSLSPPSTTSLSPHLPYHYLPLSSLLLSTASDDIPHANTVRRLLRDLHECRMAKMRAGTGVLEGGREVRMDGVGGMEVAAGRGFVAGVVDGLRVVGGAGEEGRREREREGEGGEEEEEEMEF